MIYMYIVTVCKIGISDGISVSVIYYVYKLLTN